MKVLSHCSNDSGGWGAGFVKAINRRWTLPETAYRQWYRSKKVPDRLFDEGKVFTTGGFALGEVQFSRVAGDLWVASIIGQRSYTSHDNYEEEDGPPIRYEAIEAGLRKIRDFCLARRATVHMPRMGTGFAGGEWSRIEALVQAELINHNIVTTVYDL